MAKSVDHEERRREIMSKALHLISERGYRNVKCQHVADSCGFSRTTLYKYYRDMREIFDCAMLSMVKKIGEDFENTVRNYHDISPLMKIRILCVKVIEKMDTNTPLLRAIVEYLVDVRRREEPVGERVRRHTVGMHRLLTRLIREGVRCGELRNIDPRVGAETLYSQLESATLRLSLIENFNQAEFIGQVDLILEGMRAR